MSRIHDALRRGREPAVMPQGGRTAHADAVLSALGYPSEKPRGARSRMALLALAIGGLALVAWAVMRPDPKPPVVRQGAPSAPATRASSEGPKPGSLGQGSNAVSSTPLPATRTPAAGVAAPPSPGQTPATSIDHARTESLTPGMRPNHTEATPPVGEFRTSAVRRPSPAANAPAATPPSQPHKAIAASPDEFQLALYYQRAGEFEQALVHYRAALQRDEMNVEAHNNLGHLYLGKNLYDEAAREFQRVLAIDSKYLNAHLNLSAAYLSLKRFDAAAAEARAALQIDPRNPDAMVNLALAQNGSGQAGDAQGSLRRALEIDPRNAAAHYNLARQYDATGETAAAIDHYKLFIQYASPEQTAYADDVRTRLGALGARLK